MKYTFTGDAWSQYLDWQLADRKIIKKINDLIEDISRNGFSNGIGKPEPLKHDRKGQWSRRITDEHRLVYRIDSNGNIEILSCFGHYE